MLKTVIFYTHITCNLKLSDYACVKFPASYTMRTRGLFSGVKRPGREADHSPPTSVEVKKMWIYTSTPPYTFMASWLIS
jgi:hypothetical protein